LKTAKGAVGRARLKSADLKQTWAVKRIVVKGRPLLTTRRFFSLIYLQSKKALHLDYSFYMPAPSSVPIDVFMPVVEKDAETLGYSIRSIRDKVKHPISNIYIVSPASALSVKRVAEQEKCVFVDESTVLPFTKDRIKYVHNGENRGGWIFKMLLNLSSDSVCRERYILIVDSDVVFLRPRIFVYKNKSMFNLSDFYHQPYFDADVRIMGLKHRISRSFISHFMIFDTEALKKLRQSIKQAQGREWYDGIIDNLDVSEGSSFADYEIYGDYFVEVLKWPHIFNYWSSLDLTIDKLSQLPELIPTLQNKLSTITFHNTNRD
jgi:hypothetical protein